MRLRPLLAPTLLLLALAARPLGADDFALVRPRLDAAAGRYALALARRAFDAYAKRREVLPAPADPPAPFNRRMGVFVSAMRHGAPRCCMGTLRPTESNAAAEIVASAVAAAGRDLRFPPVRPSELGGLLLIVSFVGNTRPLDPARLAELDPTRDGLAVKRGANVGVVLSGETADIQKALAWGRIRAGARPGQSVQLFQLESVRFVESPRPKRSTSRNGG